MQISKSFSEIKLTPPNDRKLLELKEIVGFIDMTSADKPIHTLRLDDEGGSYNHDLSLRLQREEIMNSRKSFCLLTKLVFTFALELRQGSLSSGTGQKKTNGYHDKNCNQQVAFWYAG